MDASRDGLARDCVLERLYLKRGDHDRLTVETTKLEMVEINMRGILHGSSPQATPTKMNVFTNMDPRVVHKSGRKFSNPHLPFVRASVFK
jgi:hypothetical protein